jgi:hypothetical protein
VLQKLICCKRGRDHLLTAEGKVWLRTTSGFPGIAALLETDPELLSPSRLENLLDASMLSTDEDDPKAVDRNGKVDGTFKWHTKRRRDRTTVAQSVMSLLDAASQQNTKGGRATTAPHARSLTGGPQWVRSR